PQGLAPGSRARLRAGRRRAREGRLLHRGARSKSHRRCCRRHQRRRPDAAHAENSGRQRRRVRGRRGGDRHFHRPWIFRTTCRIVQRRVAGAWRTKVKRAVLGLVIAAWMLPVVLAAQAVTGTIIGLITDSTGAVMPGATVTLTNTGTGLVRVIVTDANGEYTAPSLPTGTYAVKAELAGFKTMNRPDI